jgi:hypothetical protein
VFLTMRVLFIRGLITSKQNTNYSLKLAFWFTRHRRTSHRLSPSSLPVSLALLEQLISAQSFGLSAQPLQQAFIHLLPFEPVPPSWPLPALQLPSFLERV